MYQLIQGDCIESMKRLEAGSVQCCVTSPPYFGLRDYGHDGQIGLEETPEAYVAKLVDVFREVRRLLRDDGVLWLNLGDSYNGSGGAGGDYGAGGLKEGQPKYPGRRIDGLKPKDLIGIPWMVAFALRADGWYLRSDIIWHKPNPMPESVTDRPTKAHEYIFLLSKSAHYFYDADAVREPHARDYSQEGWANVVGKQGNKINSGVMQHNGDKTWAECMNPLGRNRRSVWTVTTKPYSGAHFATFPPDLIEPCILAGTSAHGCCAACGAPWARVVEVGESRNKHLSTHTSANIRGVSPTSCLNHSGEYKPREKRELGWQPTCTCFGHFELIEPEPEYDQDGDETVASRLRPPHRVFVADGNLPDAVPCTVLDPFSGSGTVGAVSLKHGRRYIGLELNPDYIELAHTRIGHSQPMLAGIL